MISPVQSRRFEVNGMTLMLKYKAMLHELFEHIGRRMWYVANGMLHTVCCILFVTYSMLHTSIVQINEV